MSSPQITYEAKKARAIAQMKHLAQKKGSISLKAKSTTHFFRSRKKANTLDLLDFTEIISIDTERGEAQVEGGVKFYDLVEKTLPLGFIPAVTPELRAITVGGAIAGLGVEATSFRYGLFHETVKTFELLTSTGEVMTCSEDEHKDLFQTVPNALGTLGYVLKATVKLMPVKKYVKMEVVHFDNSAQYFEALESHTHRKEVDFLDGAINSTTDYVLLVGSFSDHLPPNQTLFHAIDTPFFLTIRHPDNKTLFFTTKEYLWRWDYDCFWETDRPIFFFGKLLLQPIFRKLFGWFILRSDRLIKFGKKLNSLSPPKSEYEPIVQDVAVPLRKCVEFMEWYDQHIGLHPIWICPVEAMKPAGTYPLSRWSGEIVVDIGFYSEKKLPEGAPKNLYNEAIEEELERLGAFKGLYSLSFYTEEEFWLFMDKARYEKVKKKYDPHQSLPDVYQKAVGWKTL